MQGLAKQDLSSPDLSASGVTTRNLFITFEGIDGGGKTTQANMLSEALTRRGVQVCLTREPGGTTLGKNIRQMLLNGPDDIDSRTEALLYAADRAYHVKTVVQPALQAGQVVVQDRYIDSSLAYQGAGRSLDTAEIRNLSEWATEGLCPDLTLLFDLPAEVASQRLRQRRLRRADALDAFSAGNVLDIPDIPATDRLEDAGVEFQNQVRAGFLNLAQKNPERIRVINAADSVNRIHENVLQIVLDRLALTNSLE